MGTGRSAGGRSGTAEAPGSNNNNTLTFINKYTVPGTVQSHTTNFRTIETENHFLRIEMESKWNRFYIYRLTIVLCNFPIH